jgi:uncharacterized membrane protein YphA (DoxX/SURF4 family)
MLNTFPSLLTYSWYAPLILRLVLGLILVDLGILKFRGERKDWITTFAAYKIRPAHLWVSLYGLLEIVGGAFLIFGFLTQVAALAFVLLSGIEFYIEYTEGAVLKRDIVFYILVFAIARSLLLTGAGAFARDLPL